MDIKSKDKHTADDSKRMKYEDLQKFSHVFSKEFNNSSLHDRVLVFEVIDIESKDGNVSNYSMHSADSQEINCERGNSKVKEEVEEKEEAKKVNGKRRKSRRKGNMTEVVEDDKSENGTDVSKQHKVFVHSSWLAVQSPYFRALFYSGMKESYVKEVIMKIPVAELEAHLIMIEAMYRLEVLDDKDHHLILQVLMLAIKYDVDLVFKKCNYILMSTSLTLESCEDIVEIVQDLPGCSELLGVVEKFLVKEFTPFNKTWILNTFITLSEALLKILLSSDHLPVQCENTIFVALMEWVGFNLTARERVICSLLHLVRFELMTIDFLYDVVHHHAVAKKMPNFNDFLLKSLAYHGFSVERQNQLKTKPVKRSPCLDNSPVYSWIIDKDERKKLSDSSHTQSSPFWFQGYQMYLTLGYKPDSNSFSIFMYALNIREESHLNICWTAKSNLFKNRSVASSHAYTDKHSGWGRQEVKSGTELFAVAEAVSHTIDVSVKFI